MIKANRIDKRGGGVAFYVQKDFQCKLIDSTVDDDILESLTIEIHSTNFKRIFFELHLIIIINKSENVYKIKKNNKENNNTYI